MSPRADLQLSHVLSAMSVALDITEGEPVGHAARSCLLGMRIAEEIELGPDDRSALFYALLLKDAGCSSNAARISTLFAADDQAVKRDRKLTYWPTTRYSLGHVLRTARPRGSLHARAVEALRVARSGASGARDLIQQRCDRGADIAGLLGFPAATADAIRGLDEHWDGGGYPSGLAREETPLLGRILGIAQTLEVFSARGRDAAYEMARRRRGKWFDPDLVDAFEAARDDDAFWAGLDTEGGDLRVRVSEMEPEERVLAADDEMLDRVSVAFSQVVDAKSPWTYRHSLGVASVAEAMGRHLGLAPGEQCELRRAALLHDLGKLGVSNLVLDKAEPLTDEEWRALRRHPRYTALILREVPGFETVTELAAAHHERLDGTGYYRGLSRDDLSLPARALAVADVYDALRSERPYRPALDSEHVLDIMRLDRGSRLCEESFAALEECVEQGVGTGALETGVAQAARA